MKDINLVKRARAKYFTLAFLYPLIDLQGPNNKKYWSAWHCSRNLIAKHYVTHTEIKGKYCKQRFCTVCNRIRTAQYIHAYSDTIHKFSDPQFLTLTLRNCRGQKLRGMVERTVKFFREFNRFCTKNKISNKYLRKLEITYNIEDNSYHPHYHIVTSDSRLADLMLEHWMNYWPRSWVSPKAQKIEPCDENAHKELFKYFCEVIKKKNGVYEFEAIAFDIIISALDRIRIFQPVGIKSIKEPEQLSIWDESLKDILHEKEYIWNDRLANWVGLTSGNALIKYNPNDKFRVMLKEIGLDDRDMRELSRKHDYFSNSKTKNKNTFESNRNFNNESNGK